MSVWKPIPPNLMLLSSSATSHAQQTRLFGVSALLTKKEANQFKVNTSDLMICMSPYSSKMQTECLTGNNVNCD